MTVRWKVESVHKNGTRVRGGVAWKTDTGEINIYLDVLPVDGQLVLVEESPEEYSKQIALREAKGGKS